jgi:Tol biopolymer transport system component
VLFTSDRTGDNDIWQVGLDGSGPTRLTDDGADDDVAVTAPDGSRIAFVSTRTGDA